MEIKKRIEAINVLVKHGYITRFDQLFDQIPPTIVSQALGTNYNRFTRLVENPEDFKIIEIIKIAAFLGIEEKRMLLLVCNQLLHKKVIREKDHTTSTG